MSYMAQQKAIYAKAYERLSDEDDQKLLSLYAKGKLFLSLCKFLKETEELLNLELKN